VTSPIVRVWAGLLPLYVLIALAVGFVDFRLRPHVARGYEAYPRAVIENTEDPPGKYRVLAPYVFEALVTVGGASRELTWVVFRFLCLLAGLYASHWLFSAWFQTPGAALGSVLNAVLLLLTFTNSWPHPDHLVEWAVVTAGAAALVHGRLGLFAGILLVAALNRETSFFLWLLAAAALPWTRRHLMFLTATGSGWVAVYAGLRVWRGVAMYDPWQAGRNLEFLGLLPEGYDPYYRAYAWFGVALLAPAVWAAWRSWDTFPRLVRAGIAVVVPAFVVVAFLFSSIIETRIFTPLLPLLASAVMFHLHSADMHPKV
jgi:hypothetical protein